MGSNDTDAMARTTGCAFVFHSRPRCSLTREQARWTFRGLAAASFGVATAFSALGYWMILPFAGLEIGLLAWAFETVRGRENDFETLTIEGDAVTLEWCDGKKRGRREMNRRWMRIECDSRAPEGGCRLNVRSHGCGSEVGRFLSDEARRRLAAVLRHRLRQ